MSTHNICFRQEIRKILCGYPLLSVAMLSSDKIFEPAHDTTNKMACASSEDSRSPWASAQSDQSLGCVLNG